MSKEKLGERGLWRCIIGQVCRPHIVGNEGQKKIRRYNVDTTSGY